HFISSSQTEGRPAGEKEGYVGADVRRDISQLRDPDGHTPRSRERNKCGRSIGAATPEARLKWDLLLELHDHAANGTIAPQRSPHGPRRSPNQICSVERHARRVALDREGPFARNAADGVAQ